MKSEAHIILVRGVTLSGEIARNLRMSGDLEVREEEKEGPFAPPTKNSIMEEDADDGGTDGQT